ncbi:MAG TPA: hypothetical protein VGG61_13080 [Gemmataceae bacterium]
MDHDSDSQGGSRATFVVFAAAILFGLPCVGFLAVITDGYVLVVPVGLLLIGAFAGVHYLLWGRSMSRSTAGEREEEELRETLEANEWDLPDTRRPGHYR